MLFFTSLVVAAVAFGKLRSWCEDTNAACLISEGLLQA